MDDILIDTRLTLHALLVGIMAPNKVYFQPPSSIKLTYPCIIYRLDGISTNYADSVKYKNKKRYTVTVIDQDPDSIIPSSILSLDYCSFDRSYVSDNLNHYFFTLYY